MKNYSNINLNSDLSENIPYNNPEFPASIKKLQLSNYLNFRGVSHWHNDLEFILVLDGQMSYDVNGHHISMQKGEGIFVNSQCFHYSYSNTHTECNFICILLSPSLFPTNEYFLNNFFNPLIQNIHFPYQKLTPTITWHNIILHDLWTLYENTANKIQPFLIIEKFAHILSILFENMNVTSNYNENADDISSLTAMIGYVQKNYPRKIFLKDISTAGNCCKTKCSCLFQKYLSTSPVLYLNNYRLEKSVFLLKNTTMSITEIAYTCGFSSTSYFCELFHKNYSITPKAYRLKILE